MPRRHQERPRLARYLGTVPSRPPMPPHPLSAPRPLMRRRYGRWLPSTKLRSATRLVLTLTVLLAMSGWSFSAESELVVGTASSKSAGADREYQLKSAFLYNFIRYTSWPEKAFAEDTDPIVLTIIGTDPFGKQIDDLFRGKQLHDRSVEVRRANEVPTKAESHVVFASGLEKAELAILQQLYHKRPTLVVGEAPEVIKSGAQCNFYIEGGKVRFEVNTDNLELADLKISSQLLKLARIVTNEEKR